MYRKIVDLRVLILLRQGRCWLGCAALLGSVAYVAQNAGILPAPREIHHGVGVLSLDGISIQVAGLSADDRFSAGALAGCLGDVQHREIPIKDLGADHGRPTLLLERTGAEDPLPVPGDLVGPDSREAYSLTIDATGAKIQARSSAGLFYGVQTLCQMVERTPSPSLPFATVRDWPAMAFRGTMVDMSEGQLLKVPEIKHQIDLMARLKMNQYYFYNELTIALDGLPPAAPGARISKDDVRAIIAYGRQRHIDVIPCLELYGHLHDLFRREQYSDLADFPHGVEFDPTKPKARELVEDWARQYLELFPSPFVHVGFDETWQLRQAASSNSSSPAEYFVEQLRFISQLFQSHGKTVMAWADIMVKYPQIIEHLPAGIIAVPWYYDPRPDPTYAHWIDPLAKTHQPFIVAPGISGFNEIAPDNKLTFDNIDTLVSAGRRKGALGMMNTLWSDDLQMLKGPALPGIAYGAVAAWQQTAVDRTHFFTDYAALVSSPTVASKLADALAKMTQSETALQRVLGQDTMVALWVTHFEEKMLTSVSAHLADLRESRLAAEEAEDDLLAAIGSGADRSSLDAYLVECRLLDYAGLKLQYSLEIDQAWKGLGSKPTPDQLENDFDNLVVAQQHGKLVDLMEAITELKPQYQQVWLEEYTSFRLGESLGRWDAEYEYWRKLQANFQGVINNYDPNVGLPAFRSMLPAQ